MPELRIILLVLGVVFVAAIAGFEWWRSRGPRPAAVVSRDDSPAEAPRSALPDIHVVREARTAVADTLPVIELASTSETGTRRALGISISNEVAVDMSQDSSTPAPARTEPYIGQDDSVSEVSEVDTSAYLTKHSDIVALIVLEHLVEAHNRIIRATHGTIRALRDEKVRRDALGEKAEAGVHSDSTIGRIKRSC